ncbi:hypothetical protein O0544_22180 [Edwardsiella anguillarum]|nr:hypothetical protein [Edwardsiella anguillarum]
MVLDGEVDIALAETILLDISETIDHETFDFVLSSEDNGETIHLADIEINNLLSDAGDKILSLQYHLMELKRFRCLMFKQPVIQ